MPRVTVLMAVYNGARYLREAIDSILRQTFTNFEFIIVDDGSSDETSSILSEYQDSRLRLIINLSNLGQTSSLNLGLALAQGEYIARMDADDVSLPTRLENQIDFMERHPDVGLLGTSGWLIGSRGKRIASLRKPVQDIEVRWAILLGNPFVHSSVMLRREVLNKHRLAYDTHFQVSQDYDLWSRLLKHSRGTNLSKPLMNYRLHTESLTQTHAEKMLGEACEISKYSIRTHLPEFSLTNEQGDKLVSLFGLGLYPVAALKVEGADIVHRYLDMYASFAARYPTAPELTLLRRNVVLTALKVALRLPWSLRVAAVTRRALTLDVGALWLAAKKAPEKAYYRWQLRSV